MKYLKFELSTIIFVLLGFSVILVPIIILITMLIRQGSDQVEVSVYSAEYSNKNSTYKNTINIDRISYHPKTKLKRASMWFTGNYERPGYIQIDGTFNLNSNDVFVKSGLIKINNLATSVIKELILKDIECNKKATSISNQKFSGRFNLSQNNNMNKLLERNNFYDLEFELKLYKITNFCEGNILQFETDYLSYETVKIQLKDIYIYKPYKLYEFEEEVDSNIWIEWISSPEFGELK
tara:strand:+ start:1055 stop:1765 length:711 start_codon:yes stop_codon:yes gene_type:complete